jgi:hypothetical protein
MYVALDKWKGATRRLLLFKKNTSYQTQKPPGAHPSFFAFWSSLLLIYLCCFLPQVTTWMLSESLGCSGRKASEVRPPYGEDEVAFQVEIQSKEVHHLFSLLMRAILYLSTRSHARVLKGSCQVLRYVRISPHTCFIEIQGFLLNTRWFLFVPNTPDNRRWNYI